MKRFKFVIVSSRQYSGGAIALHALCKYLADDGYDARIFHSNVFVYRRFHKVRFWIDWIAYLFTDVFKEIAVKLLGDKGRKYGDFFKGYYDESVKGYKRKVLPFVDKNTIVVYPEIVFGNFLRAKNVVRWFLFYNRYPNYERAYGKKDLFFAYRSIFNDEKYNPEKRLLCLSYFDLDLYKRTNFGERSGTCYIIRKGKLRSDLPASFDGVIIDDLPEGEKVKVFNQCQYCVSYDSQTAYSDLAALCGCISVIVPEPGKTREDYRVQEDKSYGVAFGFAPSEIEYAEKTSAYLLDYFVSINEDGKRSSRKFVEECEKYFKS